MGCMTFVLNCDFVTNRFSGHSTFVLLTVDVRLTCSECRKKSIKRSLKKLHLHVGIFIINGLFGFDARS